MKQIIITAGLFLLASTTSLAGGRKSSVTWFDKAVKSAAVQTDLQIKGIEANKDTTFLNPVSTKKNRHSTSYCKYTDWRSGFFPGSLWYLYELTGNKNYLKP